MSKLGNIRKRPLDVPQIRVGDFPVCLGDGSNRSENIGIRKTDRIVGDIQRRLLCDKKAYCTIFSDYDGLDTGFAGKGEADGRNGGSEKARIIEDALMESVRSATDDNAVRRFVPYIQMYEFEGLLFSSPDALSTGLCVPNLKATFREIREAFPAPEEINDSPVTAPSKRLLKFISGYDKTVYGSLAALEIGLAPIRAECKRFDSWMSNLETLGARS